EIFNLWPDGPPAALGAAATANRLARVEPLESRQAADDPNRRDRDGGLARERRKGRAVSDELRCEAAQRGVRNPGARTVEGGCALACSDVYRTREGALSDGTGKSTFSD